MSRDGLAGADVNDRLMFWKVEVMERSKEFESCIRRLFPQGTMVCLSKVAPSDAELLSAELPGTKRMAPARLLEFAHGRACARIVLDMCGAGEVAVPRGKNREPLWPQGTVGSISHTGSLAAAVATRTSDLTGIGLDIENAEPLSQDMIAMICRQDEEVGADGFRAKLLFSIKESIYKCIFPIVGIFVDFQEVKVFLDEQSKTFTALADAGRHDLAVVQQVKGAYCVESGLVFSAAWLQ